MIQFTQQDQSEFVRDKLLIFCSSMLLLSDMSFLL